MCRFDLPKTEKSIPGIIFPNEHNNLDMQIVILKTCNKAKLSQGLKANP